MTKNEVSTAPLPPVELEEEGKDLFFIHDGKRIAKRGYPGTAQARQWISIEPGYTVREVNNSQQIEVRYNPKAASTH